MDNKKRSKVLLASYQKAYPDVLKKNQFKAAQRAWNHVKSSPEDYETFLLILKAKAANIRQLQYPGGLNQKGR